MKSAHSRSGTNSEPLHLPEAKTRASRPQDEDDTLRRAELRRLGARPRLRVQLHDRWEVQPGLFGYTSPPPPLLRHFPPLLPLSIRNNCKLPRQAQYSRHRSRLLLPKSQHGILPRRRRLVRREPRHRLRRARQIRHRRHQLPQELGAGGHQRDGQGRRELDVCVGAGQVAASVSWASFVLVPLLVFSPRSSAQKEGCGLNRWGLG